ASLGGVRDQRRAVRRRTREDAAAPTPAASLPERLYASWRGFDGGVLLILCDADMTGREFADLIKGSRQWRSLLNSKPLEMRRLAGADHTFSRAAWRRQALDWRAAWIRNGAGRASDSSGAPRQYAAP